ncbi:hypothetical protein, partial [Haloquadratum walsbyi]|uniref:hypothetical protein n=1 Tax=Haloquadratum walsbyi TaxID=293091 RepID=UPI0026EF027D
RDGHRVDETELVVSVRLMDEHGTIGTPAKASPNRSTIWVASYPTTVTSPLVGLPSARQVGCPARQRE